MSDGNKKLSFTYNAPVSLTFALVSFIALVLGWVTGGKTTQSFFEVYRSPISFAWFIRLFGHVLGHSSLAHYASNMTLFLLLGPVLENKYGGGTLLETFGIVAVISGLINIIFFPHSALLGASGLVFMMIVLVSAEDLRSKEIPISMILVIVIYLGSEIWNMVAVRDNISQLTHVIGGLCGAVFGGILNSKK
ncbi:MAG: rhomboid family intramembrane serine protease [Eubacterium sp.]|nr:rhomboid family intramembrane serine protease [Eubacterium sp.]